MSARGPRAAADSRLPMTTRMCPVERHGTGVAVPGRHVPAARVDAPGDPPGPTGGTCPYLRVMAAPAPVRDLPVVHPETTVAETLPRVYRRALDAVARLAALGERREADRFRRAAIEVYSRAWDTRTHRRLEEILARTEALVADREQRPVSRIA